MSWSSFDVEVEVAPACERVLFSIDRPRPGAAVYGDRLDVVGWAVGVNEPVTAVQVDVVGQPTIGMAPAIPRDDVAAAHPQCRDAGHSGFWLLATIPDVAHPEVSVSILVGGERTPGGIIRLTRRPLGRWTGPDAPLVSVVIPCLNQGRFLGEAIESVRRQTYRRVELIVVDDGSTDDTSAVAASSGVRCIRQENRGVSAARNRGAVEAAGEYVVFLDADDRLLPHALEANVDAFDERPEAALSSGWFRCMGPRGEPVPWASSAPWLGLPLTPPERDHYVALLQRSYHIAALPSVMFRREVFLAVGGFDESSAHSEDYELYLRIAREHPILAHNVPIAEYRFHPGSVSTDTGPMLESALGALRAQWPWVRRDPGLLIAYRHGVASFHEPLGDKVARDLERALRGRPPSPLNAAVLAPRYPSGLVRAIGIPAQLTASLKRAPGATLASGVHRVQECVVSLAGARLGQTGSPLTHAARRLRGYLRSLRVLDRRERR